MNSINLSTDTTLTVESSPREIILSHPSLFTSSELKISHFESRENKSFNPDWILGILIFGFILLTWSQVFYHRRIRQIFLAPYSKRFNNQLIRDGNLFIERVSIALGVLYILVVSLLLYQVNAMILLYPFFSLPPWAIYLIIVLGFSGFWLVKTLFIQFLSKVFNTPDTTRAYLLNILIFCLLTGAILLPMLVLVLYLNSLTLLWVCIGLYTLIFLFRVMRGFFIGISLTRFSYLFLFVYLCSLEFLPLLVLLKVFLIYA